jgi:hypothetical protein
VRADSRRGQTFPFCRFARGVFSTVYSINSLCLVVHNVGVSSGNGGKEFQVSD